VYLSSYLLTYFLIYFSFIFESQFLTLPHSPPRPLQYAYQLSLCTLIHCHLRFPNIRFQLHSINGRRNNQTALHHALRHTVLKLCIRFMKFIGSHPQEKQCFSFTKRGCTNFPKIWERPPNSRRQKGESGYQATSCNVYWRWRFGAETLVTPDEGHLFSYVYGDSGSL